MTLRELLYIQLHGEENLKEESTKKDISSYINEEFDFFAGTKRVENILEGLDESLSYIPGIRKAAGFIRVYENKVLKESTISKNGANILLHDVMNGLLESVHNLEKSVISYGRADKEKLAKIYSTLLFETQMIGDKFGIDIENLVFKNEELGKLVEEDFNFIAKEVL